MTDSERLGLMARCGRVFSPSAPINKHELFAGRLGETQRIISAINTRGRHCVMYGERGVGKTSLANILKELFADIEGMKFIKTNCVETDDFESIWRRALSEIHVLSDTFPIDGETTPMETTLDQLIVDGRCGPGEVFQLLQRNSNYDLELVVIFDEFDRLEEPERALFADTIKALSDDSVCTTLILVGVARDVVDLIVEHASIDRCIDQVLMPLMTDDELGEILSKATKALEMTIRQDAKELIVTLSQGLPHYTHLLGQESTLKAIANGRAIVTIDDVNEGTKEAISKSQQTVRNDYHKAIAAQRKGTLFPQVLLACALAEIDELGYFSSSDVREPLRKITGEDYDIPNYSQHLDKFSSDDDRGPVLEKRGGTRKFRFKFKNPLLRPFIIMKGLTDGVVSGDLVTKLRVAFSDSRKNQDNLS